MLLCMFPAVIFFFVPFPSLIFYPSHMRSGLHGGETQPRCPFVRAPEGHFINLLSGVCVLPSLNRTESVNIQIEPEIKIDIGFKSPSRLRKKIISY